MRASPTNLTIHESSRKFGYTDSVQSEMELAEVLSEVDDLSSWSEALLERADSWAIRYHLDRGRTNLLRHLRLSSAERILELGAGCGAVTRHLGELGASVTAVEGAINRAALAAERVLELSNVKVVASPFDQLHEMVDGTFSIVTMIGVLEYARKFSPSPKAEIESLQMAVRYLDEDGVLVIAIENRLGLKYLLGAPEDHVGDRYVGVEDRYRSDGVRTWGRRELGALLAGVGLEVIEFHYPWPDYKFPTAVVSDQYLETDPRGAAAMLGPTAVGFNGHAKPLRADVAAALEMVVANGLAGELANSFLVVAGRSRDAVERVAPPQWRASVYAASRLPEYSAATVISAEAPNAMTFQKHLLYVDEAPIAQLGDWTLEWVGGQGDYVPGPTLHSHIVAEMRHGNRSSALAALARWWELLREAGADGSAFDCNPRNLVCDEADSEVLHRIDTEWSLRGEFLPEIEFVRYLSSLSHLMPELTAENRLAIPQVASELGILLHDSLVGQAWKMDDLLGRAVYSGAARRLARTHQTVIERDAARSQAGTSAGLGSVLGSARAGLGRVKRRLTPSVASRRSGG